MSQYIKLLCSGPHSCRHLFLQIEQHTLCMCNNDAALSEDERNGQLLVEIDIKETGSTSFWWVLS